MGRILCDLVEQDLDWNLGADCESRLVDPLAGKRRHSPSTDEDMPAAIGDHTHAATGVAFIGPGAAYAVGNADFNGGNVPGRVGSTGATLMPAATAAKKIH